MKGKIFRESDNLFQDQAKVLFDFYKQKAEQIVGEEERLEKMIAVNKQAVEQLETEKKSYALYKTIGFVLFFTLIGLVYGFIYMGKEKKAGQQISDLEAQNAEYEKQHKNIFRDYKMSKMGVVYVPIASQIGFENKSFLLDHTQSVPKEEFRLQIVKQSELLTDKINELEELSGKAPLVEDSTETEKIDTDQYSRSIQKVTYHDYFGKLDRNLRTSAYCLRDLDVESISLPVIYPDSTYARDLSAFATTETESAPVVEPFDTKAYDEDVKKFNSINELRRSLSRRSEQFEDVLKRVMVNMANSVQTVTSMKVSSSNKLVDYSNNLLFRILKSSYNHYSATLEAEEIGRIGQEDFDYSHCIENYKPFQLKESSRVRFDLHAGTWVAEDGSRTNFPFGISQIQEEIVAPIVQNLMQETRLERMKIYNSIKDQKLRYTTEWHRDSESFYRSNREASDNLINLMRASMREFIAAKNTLMALEKTNRDMAMNQSLDATTVAATENDAEVLAAYETQSKQFEKVQCDFEDYMDRLKDEIDERAKEFGHIEYYDASLRDGSSRDLSVAASEVGQLDDRRRPLASVNPLYAKQSVMPPMPDAEELVHEHMSINLNAMAMNALQDLEDAPDEKEEEARIEAEPVAQEARESDYHYEVVGTKEDDYSVEAINPGDMDDLEQVAEPTEEWQDEPVEPEVGGEEESQEDDLLEVDESMDELEQKFGEKYWEQMGEEGNPDTEEMNDESDKK